jgi:hypothetical protein
MGEGQRPARQELKNAGNTETLLDRLPPSFSP